MLSKEKLKFLRKLQQKKYRDESGLVLAEGERVIEQIISDQIEIRNLFVSDFREHYQSIISKVDKEKIVFINDIQKNQLSATVSSQGVFALIEKKNLQPEKYERLLYLDRIADPSNLGTIIRTASGSGIDAIILSRDCCDEFNPKVVRASVGKVFSTPIMQETDFIDGVIVTVKEKINLSNFTLIVTDCKQGKTVFELENVKPPYILVAGAEATGVNSILDSLANERIKIPMRNNLESLNVSVATGICLYLLNQDILR